MATNPSNALANYAKVKKRDRALRGQRGQVGGGKYGMWAWR